MPTATTLPRGRAWRGLAPSLALALAGLGAASTLAQTARPEPAAATIAVTAILVEGNTLLSEEAIRAVTARGVGTVSLEALQGVAAALQAEYRKEGYGGVVVVVPQQALAGGAMTLRVLEGKLAKVKITGQQFVTAENVRAGVPSLREGQTPRLDRLDREIQMSNESPTKELVVTLVAGSQRGEIDAEVQVKDARPLQFLGAYSNTGDPGTGKHRISAGVRHNNLFDRDHIGTLQVQTSPEDPGQVAVLSVGYRLPLYEHGVVLDAFLAHSDVSLGTTTTPAGPLSFTGRGTILGLRANRALRRIGEYEQRVIAGVDARRYGNECSLGTLGAAGCGPSGVSVSILPLSLAYSLQSASPESALGGSVTLHANAGGSSQATFEAARAGARRHYAIVRANAFGQWAVAPGWQVAARGDLQFARDPLISPEKFGLGGAASVRGYRERELTGDSGYQLRLEALAPDLTAGFAQVRPLAFVDHGHVSHKDATACRATSTSCTLNSAGFGLRMQAGPHVLAHLDAGRALSNANTTQRGSWRLHAAVNVVY